MRTGACDLQWAMRGLVEDVAGNPAMGKGAEGARGRDEVKGGNRHNFCPKIKSQFSS